MAWTKNFRRTPTWPSITIQLVLGTVMLTNAVLSVTRFWAQTVVHRDGLLRLPRLLSAVSWLARTWT